MEPTCLLVGLGNIGPQYEWTRHNLGFLVLKALAQKQGLSFKRETKFEGEIALWKSGEKTVLLLLPSTYMNLSGRAVRKVVDWYKIPFDQGSSFLAVVDDVYLDYGHLRFRYKGSSGGHNGLKSLTGALGSDAYPRLRLGVGQPSGAFRGPLEEYVLSSFNEKERAELPLFLERGVEIVESFVTEGIAVAATRARVKANPNL